MKYLITIIFASFLAVGCSSTSQPILNSAPIEVSTEELKNFWVSTQGTFKFRNKVKKMPTTAGEVKVRFLIDSTGTVVNPEIVSSDPNGDWNSFALNAVNNLQYEASESNSDRTPVYTTADFSFSLGAEL